MHRPQTIGVVPDWYPTALHGPSAPGFQPKTGAETRAGFPWLLRNTSCTQRTFGAGTAENDHWAALGAKEGGGGGVAMGRALSLVQRACHLSCQDIEQLPWLAPPQDPS